MSNKLPFGKLTTRCLQMFVKANLSGKEMLVLMALHANAEWGGRVFAKRVRMAKLIGLNVSHFSRAVGRLEEVGFIKRQGNFIQISPQLVEYGDWSGANEVSKRAIRKQYRVVGGEEGREDGLLTGGSRGFEVDGDSVQRRPIPFPEVSVQPGQAGRTVS